MGRVKDQISYSFTINIQATVYQCNFAILVPNDFIVKLHVAHCGFEQALNYNLRPATQECVLLADPDAWRGAWNQNMCISML